MRVGAHLASLQAVLRVYNDETQEKRQIRLADVPSLAEVVRQGVGVFLR
jgi:hypothetical protein